jgi:hypothetical protein
VLDQRTDGGQITDQVGGKVEVELLGDGEQDGQVLQ